jgi:hypothetical protein
VSTGGRGTCWRGRIPGPSDRNGNDATEPQRAQRTAKQPQRRIDVETLVFWGSLLAALLVVGWLYCRDVPVRAGLELDAQHHFASVRELARGEFPPRHNLVEGFLPQGHYGPYMVLLGWVARVTGASPRTVLYAAGLVNLALFAVAFRFLAQALVGPTAGRWAVPAFLLLWGPWPWIVLTWPSLGWPGTTSLADVQNFFYPQQAGLVLLLGVVFLVAAPFAWRRLAAAAVLAAALVATHPLTGLALATALVALAAAWLVASPARPRRDAALIVAIPAVALAIATLWPYYSVVGLLQAAAHPGLREPWPAALAAAPAAVPADAAAGVADGAVSPPTAPGLPFLSLAGPALAGLAWAGWMAWQGRPFLLSWWALSLGLSLLPLLPLRERFVFFAILPLQIAATGLLDAAWRRKAAWSRAGAIVLILAGAVSAVPRLAWVLDRERPDLEFVTRLVPPDGVVLADRTTANGVAGLAGRKVVAPQNPDLFLVAAGGWQRVLDTDRFLNLTTPDEERRRILRTWGVTHVLIDRLSGGPAPGLLYPMLYESGGYVLYDVTEAQPLKGY